MSLIMKETMRSYKLESYKIVKYGMWNRTSYDILVQINYTNTYKELCQVHYKDDVIYE